MESQLAHGQELDDTFAGLGGPDGLMTVVGFGSLLSENSCRRTFPDLTNFRVGKVPGMRRIFTHTTVFFFETGIALPDTGEISSVACEQSGSDEIIVSLFEVPYNPQSVQAFINREHEYKFIAVQPTDLAGTPIGRLAVASGRNNDQSFFKRLEAMPAVREKYERYQISRVWRPDVYPCRTYLRHILLACKKLGDQVYENFLDSSYCADGQTSLRAYLVDKLEVVMQSIPPPEHAVRYGG